MVILNIAACDVCILQSQTDNLCIAVVLLKRIHLKYFLSLRLSFNFRKIKELHDLHNKYREDLKNVLLNKRYCNYYGEGVFTVCAAIIALKNECGSVSKSCGVPDSITWK